MARSQRPLSSHSALSSSSGARQVRENEIYRSSQTMGKPSSYKLATSLLQTHQANESPQHHYYHCLGEPAAPPALPGQPLVSAHWPLDSIDLSSSKGLYSNAAAASAHWPRWYSAGAQWGSPVSFQQNKSLGSGTPITSAASSCPTPRWSGVRQRVCSLFVGRPTRLPGAIPRASAQGAKVLLLILTLLLLLVCLSSLLRFAFIQSTASASVQAHQVLPSFKHHQPPAPASDATQVQQQDLLKSKLLFGQFLVLTQDYPQSSAQRSLLAENLVKLMDQVFLATDVRRVYSRTEVTNIRPSRAMGIIVDCNIVLSDSIAYAAQLFGVALYESLAKSNERLANQASFVIDKNSIRFNTVPDKDLQSGLIPADLLTPALTRELSAELAPSERPSANAPSQDPNAESKTNSGQQDTAEQAGQQTDSPVVWSAWSQWSSCVDKNGVCDPGRLHSRLRTCVAQRTGEKVEARQCKQRFNTQDRELEVADCAQQCALQAAAGLPPAPLDSSLMSDAPQAGPQTAPSVMVSNPLVGAEQQSAPLASFLVPAAALNLNGVKQESAGAAAASRQSLEAGAAMSGEQVGGPSSTATSSLVESSSAMPSVREHNQMSCSNCTSDEICLLLVQQKVPFCAKIKERQDESGCGGWCKQQSGQLCQPLGPGSNAFKCIHDSECLADEWRCHDSACIPLSKRCDGHYNCFDNSDERDCPA